MSTCYAQSGNLYLQIFMYFAVIYTSPFYSNSFFPWSLFLHSNEGMTWVLKILLEKKCHFALGKWTEGKTGKEDMTNNVVRLQPQSLNASQQVTSDTTFSLKLYPPRCNNDQTFQK